MLPFPSQTLNVARSRSASSIVAASAAALPAGMRDLVADSRRMTKWRRTPAAGCCARRCAARRRSCARSPGPRPMPWSWSGLGRLDEFVEHLLQLRLQECRFQGVADAQFVSPCRHHDGAATRGELDGVGEAVSTCSASQVVGRTTTGMAETPIPPRWLRRQPPRSPWTPRRSTPRPAC